MLFDLIPIDDAYVSNTQPLLPCRCLQANSSMLARVSFIGVFCEIAEHRAVVHVVSVDDRIQDRARAIIARVQIRHAEHTVIAIGIMVKIEGRIILHSAQDRIVDRCSRNIHPCDKVRIDCAPVLPIDLNEVIIGISRTVKSIVFE